MDYRRHRPSRLYRGAKQPVVRITEVEEIDGEPTGMYWGEVADTKESIPYAMNYYDLCLVG